MISPVFDGVIGHEPVLRILTHAANAPTSAYLFSGPNHVGKRLIAERFARLLLKISLTESLDAHPDFIRVTREEGDKEIKIEPTRALLKRLSMTSARGGRIVTLIEQADRLNEESGNALLKILEEPPPAVTFLLITAQPERLPATIRSRMVELAFGHIIAGDTANTFSRCASQGTREKCEPGQDPRSLLETLRSAPLGLQCQALEKIAKEMESSEDASDAWRELLQSLMRHSSSLLLENGAIGARIGFGLIHAWHLTQTTLSPRLALEWQAVQPYIIDDSSIPSFLKPSYL